MQDSERNMMSDQPDSKLSAETDGPTLRAWEMIENGRYMPRRIRGSYLGRELG